MPLIGSVGFSNVASNEVSLIAELLEELTPTGQVSSPGWSSNTSKVNDSGAVSRTGNGKQR
jgi:hypothetical protein